jgi:hypothetical protein
MSINEIEKIRDKFDVVLGVYDYYYYNTDLENNKVFYLYKGKIKKLKSEVIVISLDKRDKIKIEIRRYIARDLYIRFKTNYEELLKYLEEVVNQKEVVV